MHLLKALTDRRVFRYILAYGAAGWAVLEGVDTLADNGILPSWSYVAMFSLFLCGVPGALIVSWFHGAKGRQQMPGVERWLLGAVALFALVTTGFFVRGDLAGSEPAAQTGAAVSALAPYEDPSRVAVLYFDPRGGEDASILALGLTETLIDELSGVNPLTVMTRNGSQLFRGAAVAPDSIGRALRVGTLVDGTVTQSGERVRVDLALIRASTGQQFATARIERPRIDIFELQDVVADTVVAFLRSALGAELRAHAVRRGTSSTAAWERVHEAAREAENATALLHADDLENARESLVRADSLLVFAEAADPAWAEPIVRRGWLAYRRSRLAGMQRSEYERWIALGREHAERALALDPALASALELRGTLTYWMVLLGLVEHDLADAVEHSAEADLRAAIAAGGNAASAHNTLSHLLLNKGDVAEAKLNAQQAYARDSFLENAHLTLWRIFTSSWTLQNDVDADRSCREGARRFPDDFRFRQCALMLYALPDARPDVQRAWALLDEYTQLSPPQSRALNHQYGRAYVALALVRANLPDSARSVLRATAADPTIDPLREVALASSIGFAWLGDLEDAIEQLELYFAANPAQVDAYRKQLTSRSLPWYHQALADEPLFRDLVGAN